MTAQPPIYVIHRPQDEERLAALRPRYQQAGLNFQIVDAVDGHGALEKLAPFTRLIADHFWHKPEIKLGALGCFLSHITAWKRVAFEEAPFAIIAEDDSYPIHEFSEHLSKIADFSSKFDIVFLNNRLALWSNGNGGDLNKAIQDELLGKSDLIASSPFRGPGGDGYLLTKSAAARLLQQIEIDKIFCGVDWYLVYLSLKSDHFSVAELKKQRELFDISQAIGQRESVLRSRIYRPHLFQMDKKFNSAINHKVTFEIKALKSKLQTF